MAKLTRLLRYAWAAPNTVVGLALGGVGLLFGATAARQQGVIEIAGGRIGRRLARAHQPFGFAAMTLGHVILAVDRSALVQLRRHEHVHVRQYERWGPLFLPAYALSSLLQLLRGRNPYRENHFERQAYAATLPRRRMAREDAAG